MTNAEARFNKSLRPRKPEGSLGQTAQDVHLDSHTAPELWFCPAFFFALPSLPCYITFTFHQNGVLDVCLCWPNISLTQWHWCIDWYSLTLTAVTIHAVTDTQWHWLQWLYTQWLILNDTDCSDYTRNDWYPMTLTAVTIHAVTDTQWLQWLYTQWLILSDTDCSDYIRSDWYPITLTAVTIYAVTDTQSFPVSITSFSTHELWVLCKNSSFCCVWKEDKEEMLSQFVLETEKQIIVSWHRALPCRSKRTKLTQKWAERENSDIIQHHANFGLSFFNDVTSPTHILYQRLEVIKV